ncbi:hypothetical protein GCM10007860_33820 [Chitiniphilus shinanonensis]|uniref:Uncharacterized protein n=1 Tax=Chitiniphilus shinanonensis TaxID=553088 RepID=A0ABQ6BXT5_9NEIS|nr:hypothetical protein [Chitiniphilus shinanonensis]GLS06212.1 hypothetical protein GCM10007860_33820 [Chitiniphilus shinanonensis]
MMHDVPCDRQRSGLRRPAWWLVLASACRKTTPELEFEFLATTREARWLYGKEVANHLEQVVWPKICAMNAIDMALTSSTEKAKEIGEGKEALKKWLYSQLEEIDELFSSHLSISH